MYALLAEIWGTFLFTLVILCISDGVTASSKDGAVNGVIVIITLYSVIMQTAGISGACINPAVGLAFGVLGKFLDEYENFNGTYMFLYIVGPLIGGLLSGIFYMLLHKP